MRTIAHRMLAIAATLVLAAAAGSCTRGPDNTASAESSAADSAAPSSTQSSGDASASPAQPASDTPAADSSTGQSSADEASSYPAHKVDSAADCKPYETYNSDDQTCALSPQAHIHALGYSPAGSETCWQHSVCECEEGTSPGSENCSPCSLVSTQVICMPE